MRAETKVATNEENLRQLYQVHLLLRLDPATLAAYAPVPQLLRRAEQARRDPEPKPQPVALSCWSQLVPGAFPSVQWTAPEIRSSAS